MKWRVVIWKYHFAIIFLLICLSSSGQDPEYHGIRAGGFNGLSEKKIDSISHSEAAGKFFCQAYTQSMYNIWSEMGKLDSNGKIFIKKFANRFADYFVEAWIDNNNGNLSAASEWKCFFTANVQPWQSILLGVNAHININLWQSLVDNFIEREIHKYRRSFLRMQPGVNKVFYNLFDTLLTKSTYLRLVNSFTVGLPRKIGEHLIYKWRRRNVNLAILYFRNTNKFKRRLLLVNRKKLRIDQKILSYNHEII